MSDNLLHIALPPYLAQWYIHANGGEHPITLPRLSTENRLLEMCLIKRPSNIAVEELPESFVAIIIPEFKYKPSKKYNYLPKAAVDELTTCIRNRFLIEFWNDLHRTSKIGQRKDRLIEAWMESHGIEFNDTNWNTLAKIYQRQQTNYRVRRYRARLKSKKRHR
ncbi:MAG: hypothetical protein NC453_17160 [Muribaculum sp.]|nr:hypothetical protein [Muribaculum sp.]